MRHMLTHSLNHKQRETQANARTHTFEVLFLSKIFQDMFVSGIDSTSIALEWVMAELIRSPSIMKRAQ